MWLPIAGGCLRRVHRAHHLERFDTAGDDSDKKTEDARAETARIGWEPYMHNPSLPYLLKGVKNIPTLLIRGQKDAVVPEGCITAYQHAIAGAKSIEIPNVGHRPEIENAAEFVRAIRELLAT